MAVNTPQLYLIAYDIRDPRRLGRVHRYLRQAGLPVQYSVFTARLTRGRLERILEGLEARIETVDDIRVYPLPVNPERFALGRQIFPDDVLLIEDGINLLIR